MGNYADGDALRSILRSNINSLDATDEGLSDELTRQRSLAHTNSTAVAATAIITETLVGSVDRAYRIRMANYVPLSSTAASDTNYWTVYVRKYTAGVATTLYTLTSQTTAQTNGIGTTTALIKKAASTVTKTLAAGDIVTFELAKSATTGATYPVARIELPLEVL